MLHSASGHEAGIAPCQSLHSQTTVAAPATQPTLTSAHPKASKPAGLIYGREDKPDRGTLAVLGMEHAGESASKVTLPIAGLAALGATPQQLENMILVTLLAAGICCFAVSSKRPVVGFGYLVPVSVLSSFVGPTLLAAQTGGMALAAGMTLITGVIVLLLSRVLYRWRFLFPPEVVGLIAFMVGASQSTLAVSRFLGLNNPNQTPDLNYLIVASITLVVLAGLTVWGTGRMRLFSSTATVVIGYFVADAFGFLSDAQWSVVRNAAWIGLPNIHPPGLAFDARLLMPFVVLGLTAAMKASGDLTICEKISDRDWKRADLRRSRPALTTFGLGTILSSLFGGFMVMSSSSNIGLAAATGAVSRYIGYACGAILIGLAFLPKLVAFIVIVPAPVSGAMFLLVVSYNLIAGMQIIMSRMMEARHTYIIGLSLLFGLAADALPGAFTALPEWLRPLFSSGLTLSTTMVVLLNAIFRLGASRRQSISLDPGAESIEPLTEFIEDFGARAGARREVVSRAVSALTEFFESVTIHDVAAGPIQVSAVFDEVRLDFALHYRGDVLEIPTERPRVTFDSGPEEMIRLSGYMLRRLADGVRTKSLAGEHDIEIHFDH